MYGGVPLRLGLPLPAFRRIQAREIKTPPPMMLKCTRLHTSAQLCAMAPRQLDKWPCSVHRLDARTRCRHSYSAYARAPPGSMQTCSDAPGRTHRAKLSRDLVSCFTASLVHSQYLALLPYLCSVEIGRCLMYACTLHGHSHRARMRAAEARTHAYSDAPAHNARTAQ